ncbi:diaminobutyrate aminotransferase [Ruminiclostridium sufflavum DSM 19573]|uniref:Diaminobutyrate--2-oxoglutarate transaminase n=1 Tax=Ruminiclostridium sufflavum DSM 19573 TaxID=1121337 RepID=A0A318XKR7_9FIRM|nr:diaminobutyrate--2-oxoglutarate transaminase [Ruminiclostridium sufflavum]PYG86582.1 diaminobutyrate aminotransferase [Ruminiclostridium sufflavum DSM 19573]
MTTDIFDLYESNVRSYCRSFNAVFNKAKNAVIYSEEGRDYIDFFAGAGALNYGHNNDFIKEKILSYFNSDGIMHGLDMYTVAKRDFINKFNESILKPRGLDYKIQFCGATGTNAVEAALKLARKIKRRAGIFSFMGGFHGMTLGSLAATGNIQNRLGAGVQLPNVTFMPYPYKFMKSFDTIDYIDNVLNDANSGIEKPAAIIFETIQCEGGINIASTDWIRRLSDLCKRNDILLICDDIQAGCGRTGTFFSFDRAEIVPDIVLLSKSISGYGFPMSLLLMKREHDIWQPGEHNGTFRGNQLAFIGAQRALEYWEEFNLQKDVQEKSDFIKNYLTNEILTLHNLLDVRGIGMVWGIDFSDVGGAEISKQIARRCFEFGLIIERVGRNDTVLKIMPPLTIEMELLQTGCRIIKQAIIDVFKENGLNV